MRMAYSAGDAYSEHLRVSCTRSHSAKCGGRVVLTVVGDAIYLLACNECRWRVSEFTVVDGKAITLFATRAMTLPQSAKLARRARAARG